MRNMMWTNAQSRLIEHGKLFLLAGLSKITWYIVVFYEPDPNSSSYEASLQQFFRSFNPY